MVCNIILFFMFGSFYWTVESSEAVSTAGPPNATTNDTILELYKRLRNIENPSLKEVEAIKASDTIKSYYGHIIDGQFYAEDSFKWRVVFPTINDLQGELLLAELHVQVAGISEYLVGMDTSHMLSFPCDSTTPLADCRMRKLLRSMESANYIEAKPHGVIIDFTDELRKWFSPEGSINRMIELWTYRGTTEGLRGSNGATTFLSSNYRRRMEKHLSDRQFLLGAQERTAVDRLRSVNLVVYTKGFIEQSIVYDRLSLSSQVRHRRSTDEERMERRRKKKEKQLRKEKREEMQRAKAEKIARQAAQNGPCRVVEMEVDFEDIGWSKWILYPTSFNAKRCAGRCSGPLEAIHNPSNHAVMQDLIRLKMPGKAPEPCCIPTQLQPLSMLYIEDGTIVVRHHEEMVAMECGCR